MGVIWMFECELAMLMRRGVWILIRYSEVLSAYSIVVLVLHYFLSLFAGVCSSDVDSIIFDECAASSKFGL